MAELLVASVVGALVIVATYMIYYSQQQGLTAVDKQSDKLQNSRMVFDNITRKLRTAGFGVISGAVFPNARTYEVTFKGDVDNDIVLPLAEVALSGETELKVDLNDEEDIIEITDSVWIKNGDEKVLIPVRSVGGPAYSLESEPDTIYLSSALPIGFIIENTEVRTVETVAIQHDYNNKIVTFNGEDLARHVDSLEFHYFNGAGTEMIPEIAQNLSSSQRAEIRKIRVDLTVAAATERASPRKHTISIKLRNMEFIRADTDDLAPSPPTALQIIGDDTCGQFTISYSKPTTNTDGSPLTDLAGYSIFYGTESGAYWQPAFPVSDENVEQMEVSDVRLEDDTIYYVAMTAYDTSLNVSEVSTEVSFTLNDVDPPPPPVELSATAGDGSVTLLWSVPEDTSDVRGYRIYRGTSEGFNPITPIVDEAELTDEVFSFTDNDIDSCRTYYYRIAAIDCENEGELTLEIFGDGNGGITDYPENHVTSTTANESPPAPPQIPSGVAANSGDQSIVLNWINPSDIDFAEVLIRWSPTNYPASTTDGNELDSFSGSPGDAMTVTHSSLINGQPYYYSLFAADHCGNYSEAANIVAVPGAYSPVVEIIHPVDGAVITDGALRFQARAYDPDEATVGDPPDLAADNGKGINNIVFSVDPSPTWMAFPKTEYQAEYCGFGGNEPLCNPGNVSTWCDGAYNLFAVATDNEYMTTQSSYIGISVENGGLHIDESFVRSTSGTYKNELTFQVENTAGSTLTIIGIIPQWDRSYSRLKTIKIPQNNIVHDSSVDALKTSGEEISLTGDMELSFNSGEAKTVKLVFNHFNDNLSSGASAGSSRLYLVGDGAPFSIGETIILSHQGDTETSVIADTGQNYIDLSTPLVDDWVTGTRISYVQELSNCPMSSANVQVTFIYTLDWLSQSCDTDAFDITVNEGPVLSNPYQDEPAVNTASTTNVGTVSVENFKDVPLHVQVTDNALQGIDYVKFYYTFDAGMGDIAPDFGYADIEMTYDEPEDRWEGSLPYSSDTRVWYYFVVYDNLSQSDRLPATGAYTFDYDSDSDIPACPTGLTATKMAKRRIALSWNENSETDLRGYNIWRSKNCNNYRRVYTLVSDIDPSTPGVQYDDTNVNANRKCYKYYIVAEDMEGNTSEGCEGYIQEAGNCPC